MQSENISVKILDRDYAFACAPDEKESLLECVAMVDQKMNAIRAMGKLSAVDRIAVMAALTLANDLLATRKTKQGFASHTTNEIPLEIGAVSSRMQSTDDAIAQFLDRMRPQLGLKENGLFG